jgi:hypothetical protein
MTCRLLALRKESQNRQALIAPDAKHDPTQDRHLIIDPGTSLG